MCEGELGESVRRGTDELIDDEHWSFRIGG